jgi:hypothetical protein
MCTDKVAGQLLGAQDVVGILVLQSHVQRTPCGARPVRQHLAPAPVPAERWRDAPHVGVRHVQAVGHWRRPARLCAQQSALLQSASTPPHRPAQPPCQQCHGQRLRSRTLPSCSRRRAFGTGPVVAPFT